MALARLTRSSRIDTFVGVFRGLDGADFMRTLYAHKFEVVNMLQIFDKNATKKPTNLSVNSDLLSKARKHKINLSATLEYALDIIQV